MVGLGKICIRGQERISCSTIDQMLCKTMVLYISRLHISVSPIGVSVFVGAHRNMPAEPSIQVPELHAAQQKKFSN